MSQNIFTTRQHWWNDGLPDGVPVGSSIVITGPGGTGKPILALGFVASWIEAGGSVIVAPLQFPDPAFVNGILNDLYGLDPGAHERSLTHVALDPEADGLEQRADGQLTADLVRPDNWDRLLKTASPAVEDGPGVLLFSTALNLPLLSPSYAESLLDQFETLFDDESLTTLFCVSRSMIETRARDVESMADVLVEASVESDPKRLQLQVVRAPDVASASETIETPFAPDELATIEELADEYRVTPVQTIRDI
ncbi:hypothetical protein [Halapricum desulfuricans]|uniref:RecA-superfamily ATPase implicated in signal transduction n=1 Tax=Halapricum desulfuricans TaxID=2841257 RepID=A0A897N395_9EURY|nr:hypothetical protein [Halapricum desulfuricans]QSG08870.1 RecA-superfamily ATPase implicated in signal transduction [Halapricum desulfuricans]